jgi:hypothetical protein
LSLNLTPNEEKKVAMALWWNQVTDGMGRVVWASHGKMDWKQLGRTTVDRDCCFYDAVRFVYAQVKSTD